MRGPMGFGGHRGQPCSPPHTAVSDEALSSHSPTGLGTASEAGVGQGRTWGQGDVATRGGSVWQTRGEVAQDSTVRSGKGGEVSTWGSMSGPMSFGGHRGLVGSLPHTAENDEALGSQTLAGLGSASEAGVRQDRTWGQGDVATRGGSVWQTRGEVARGSNVRSGKGGWGWGGSGGEHRSESTLLRKGPGGDVTGSPC